MADIERDSKTEEASQRRREQSRSEGQVAYSTDLSTGLVLTALAAILWLGGPVIGDSLLGAFRQTLSHAPRTDWNVMHGSMVGRWLVGATWSAVGGFSLAILLVSVGAGLLQAGFHISTETIAIKWERLLPTRGWQKLFSMESMTKVLAAVAKIALAGTVVWLVIRGDWQVISTAGRVSVRHAVLTGWSTAVWLLLMLGLSALIVGAADYGFQWWRHEQNLKMTKEEAKQEQKEENGDPHVRSKRRQMQREMRKPRGFKNVATATVVLKNPTHFAVALLYDPATMAAPKVVAKGAGPHARRILKLAEANGVPVLERKPLARALYKMVDVGKEIPMELYQAIAEILATVYRTKKAA